MKKVSSLTKTGTIVKGIGGFYYISQDNSSDNSQGGLREQDAGLGQKPKEIECKARGLFRKDKISPMVGDEVIVEIQEDGTGYISQILPRHNQFVRPPVANVEKMAVTVALAEPTPSFDILDKFIITAEKKEVEILLVFNKLDLCSNDTKQKVEDIYKSLYQIFFVCGKTGEGKQALKNAVRGSKTAFAGPSGVGKSTLINLLIEDTKMDTGKISGKTKRGKHTTRHVELIETDFGAKIFDTPGFTSFEIEGIEKEELELYYPEIESCRASCRYKGCSHISEPDCAVKEALASGEINQSRYDSYVSQYTTLQEMKKY